MKREQSCNGRLPDTGSHALKISLGAMSAIIETADCDNTISGISVLRHPRLVPGCGKVVCQAYATEATLEW